MQAPLRGGRQDSPSPIIIAKMDITADLEESDHEGEEEEEEHDKELDCSGNSSLVTDLKEEIRILKSECHGLKGLIASHVNTVAELSAQKAATERDLGEVLNKLNTQQRSFQSNQDTMYEELEELTQALFEASNQKVREHAIQQHDAESARERLESKLAELKCEMELERQQLRELKCRMIEGGQHMLQHVSVRHKHKALKRSRTIPPSAKLGLTAPKSSAGLATPETAASSSRSNASFTDPSQVRRRSHSLDKQRKSVHLSPSGGSDQTDSVSQSTGWSEGHSAEAEFSEDSTPYSSGAMNLYRRSEVCSPVELAERDPVFPASSSRSLAMGGQGAQFDAALAMISPDDPDDELLRELEELLIDTAHRRSKGQHVKMPTYKLTQRIIKEDIEAAIPASLSTGFSSMMFRRSLMESILNSTVYVERVSSSSDAEVLQCDVCGVQRRRRPRLPPPAFSPSSGAAGVPSSSEVQLVSPRAQMTTWYRVRTEDKGKWRSMCRRCRNRVVCAVDLISLLRHISTGVLANKTADALMHRLVRLRRRVAIARIGWYPPISLE